MSSLPQRVAEPTPPPVTAPTPSHEHKPARRPWIWVLLVLVAGGVAYYAYRATRPASPVPAVAGPRTAAVIAGDFRKTIRVAGQTSARNFYNITAPLLRGPESDRALILLECAPSGSRVRKGQKIAVIDGQGLKDHIDDQNDTVEQAAADVRKRRAEHVIEWNQLEQTVRVAKAESDKAALDLKAAEVRTVIDQELLKAAAEEAGARYAQARKDLELKKAVHAAEIRLLELTYERQVRHRERHATDLKKFTIYAPGDGLVVMSSIWAGGEMRQIQVGDQLSPGLQFMKVVDSSSMQVEGRINQAESGEFRLGQRATVTLDAFPGTRFPGRIYSVGALATRSFREQYFVRNIPLLVAIEAADPRLIPDLSAAADIEIETRRNATLVPVESVRQRAGGFFVLLEAPSGFAEREVQVAARNHTQAVIASGVQPGERVRVN